MKTQNFKKLFIMTTLMLFTFTTSIYAKPGREKDNGNGIGGNNGATVTHSAIVNPNNNGNAVQGNQGNGVGNMPYGNQGSNNNPNGRTGSRQTDSIPLDGGLSILLAAAAFFGIKKLRGSKKM